MKKVLLTAALAAGFIMVAAPEGKAWTFTFQYSDQPEVVIVKQYQPGYACYCKSKYSYRVKDCYRVYYDPCYPYKTRGYRASYRCCDQGYTWKSGVWARQFIRHDARDRWRCGTTPSRHWHRSAGLRHLHR